MDFGRHVNPCKAAQCVAYGALPLWFSEEQQETAAAGAAKLAAFRTGLDGATIPIVDFTGGYLAGKKALQIPALVKNFSEAFDIKMTVTGKPLKLDGVFTHAQQ